MAKSEARRTDSGDSDVFQLAVPAALESPSTTRSNVLRLKPFEESLAALAARVIDAQRPIRILNALRWSARVEEQFNRALASSARELPQPEYDPDLGFDRAAKRAELAGIIRDIDRELGRQDPLARMLRDTAQEYLRSVDLLAARGTARFYEISRDLYGSTRDVLPDGRTTVREMGQRLGAQLGAIAWNKIGEPHPPRVRLARGRGDPQRAPRDVLR